MTSPRDPFIGLGRPGTHRPVLLGSRHMIAAGHYAAAHAGFMVLEAGGNAIDAGVTAGIALGVLHSDIVNFAGVAPIILYLADKREVLTISGLGCWPKAASVEHFRRTHGGAIPEGVLRTVVPAAPDAWITALERYGTIGFGEAAAAAIRFARDGFPMHPVMSEFIRANAARFARWPSNAAIYLPEGRAPEAGERFVQTDLAMTLQYMADQETAARSGGRAAGLAAARDAFYRGDIAAAIIKCQREHDGWLAASDLADFHVGIEPPVHCRVDGVDLYTCGAWCQGPVLAQTLKLLEGQNLAALGHNSPAYLHRITEAIKLAFADREAFYGDPRFVDVPLERLLSSDYAAARAKLIDPAKAAPGMPSAGDAWGFGGSHAAQIPAASEVVSPAADTSYVAVVDRYGNIFSATPSDNGCDVPIVPGTGIAPSSRGSQSFTAEGHPSVVGAGRRPRLTPNPAIAFFGDKAAMPFGTPGGDVQTQAMLQVFLNLTAFGMDLQSAVEAPRIASFSFPNSFEPHAYFPRRLNLERRISSETGAALTAMGHDVQWWPDWTWQAGSVCSIARDNATGLLIGAADPRRSAHAVGW